MDGHKRRQTSFPELKLGAGISSFVWIWPDFATAWMSRCTSPKVQVLSWSPSEKPCWTFTGVVCPWKCSGCFLWRALTNPDSVSLLFQGDGGARLEQAGGGKVVFCCFKTTKHEEQAENLHWFCSLSNCTAIPESSRCVTVLLCKGTCAVEEEIYSAGNSKS